MGGGGGAGWVGVGSCHFFTKESKSEKKNIFFLGWRGQGVGGGGGGGLVLVNSFN